MKDNLIDYYKILLISLISSLTITGVGFIDDKIWNLIFVIIGMVSYAIVSLLYSIKALKGKQAGKEAYTTIFLILIIIGFYIYQGVINFQKWLMSWPLWVKIMVPSILLILIIMVVILMCIKIKKTNKNT